MSKTTMGNKLPRKLEQKMQTVGEQIKLARLRRNLSIAQVAERATCSAPAGRTLVPATRSNASGGRLNPSRTA